VDQGDNPARESELRELDAAGYYAAIGAGEGEAGGAGRP
jgi:hypothetical protein